MQCSACGAENPPGNRFCGHCAAALSLRCPACGAAAQPDQKFCGQCAAPLTAGPTASVPTQAVATTRENRLVAVLFADLVSFTALSESRDAEDVRELLSRYFDSVRTVVGRYGGTIEKFIGDAVMAVWGLPAAREDDAERAVRAALDVVEAVAALGGEVGVDLQARAGVVTGSAAAWSSPGEGLVAGDRVNTAARVQSAAPAGGVYVDENTRRATSAAIAYADAGEHALKGKAEPLHLWQAERVIAGVGGSQRVDGLEARFIGRDADLRLVKELFHACVDRRSARLVSVVGGAGVGKSRLRWEFDKYLDGLADYVWMHNGRCLSYGDGVTYSALSEMMRQRFGIAEDDPADLAEEKLREGLVDLVADAAERDFLLPRLATLMRSGNTSLGREELFAGWRLLFQRLADSGPVVLAFEDLQWADNGLLDFVDYLLDWAPNSPIFIITFARPELAESRPGWPAGRRNATSLYLEPLGAGDMALLLDELVADLPGELRQRIVERSEGIPLYAVETVRSLIDRDAVVPRDGRYRVVADVATLEVPTTLTSLLAARIDGLPADERILLKSLAVLGGSFPRTTVSAVSDLDEALLDRLIADLVRKEFLSIRTDKLSPDRGQYAFAQTLLRTVAYDMLSKRERKAQHLAVAAHLRATFDNDGDEVAEVIAAHYRDALRAAETDPDAGAIRREALDAYGRAGVRAEGLGAPDAAMRIYRTAVELADEDEERLRLRERAADMALLAGRHEETYELYSSLRADYAALGRTRDWARLAVGHGRGLARLNRQAEAVQVLAEAYPVLDDGGYSAELADVAAWLANFLVAQGRASEGEPYTEKALVVSQALGLPGPLCQALITRGVALVSLDRQEEGLIHAEAAMRLARRHGVPDSEQQALITTSDLAMNTDAPEAAEYARAALEISQRRGNRYAETIAASNLIYAWLFRGEWARVEELLGQLFEAGENRPQGEYLHNRVATLASLRGDTAAVRTAWEKQAPLRDSDVIDDVCAIALADAMLANAEGRYDDALRFAGSVVDRMQVQIGASHETLRLAWVEGVEAALMLGKVDAAEELLHRISDLPPGFVPPYLKAQCARFAARIAAARGDADTPEPLFREAEAQLGALGYRYWQARVQLDHAEWLANTGGNGAADLAASAAQVFADLGALGWAERARTLGAATVRA